MAKTKTGGCFGMGCPPARLGLAAVSVCPGFSPHHEVCAVQVMPDQPSNLPTFPHSMSVHTAGFVATNKQVGFVPATSRHCFTNGPCTRVACRYR